MDSTGTHRIYGKPVDYKIHKNSIYWQANGLERHVVSPIDVYGSISERSGLHIVSIYMSLNQEYSVIRLWIMKMY